jgi:hypothetical protein
METLHGALLVKVADRYAEVPIGPALVRRDVSFAPGGELAPGSLYRTLPSPPGRRARECAVAWPG